MWWRIVILIGFLSWEAYGGYRVYRLELQHYDFNGKPSKKTETLSFLDPYQYENYHAGFGRVLVKMLDTWYCPGDTGRLREFCKKPKERAPRSQDGPKRTDLPYNRQPVIP